MDEAMKFKKSMNSIVVTFVVKKRGVNKLVAEYLSVVQKIVTDQINIYECLFTEIG